MAGTIERTIKVARWGHGLGLRIPQEVVKRLMLTIGASVRIEVSGDTITIRRAKPRRKWTEEELLEGITPALCGPDLVPDRKGRELV